MQVKDSATNIALDNGNACAYCVCSMAKKKTAESVTLRPNKSDSDLIERLKIKLGVGNSQILRIALRRLAESEDLQAS